MFITRGTPRANAVVRLALAAVLWFAALAGTTPTRPASPPVAHAASACPGGAIARVSSNIFYRDSGVSPALVDMYAGYAITNTTGAAIPDLWVQIGNFSSGAVALASHENGIIHVGPLAAGARTTVFFYLTSTGTSTTAQTHDVTLYPTRPDLASTSICSSTFSIASVQETIQASANKVDSVSMGPNPPTLGGSFTITINGHTGTVGSGGIMALTPAALDSFPATSYRLTHTSIQLAGFAPVTDTLIISGIASLADTPYTGTFTLQATGVATATASIYPINYISSGTQTKHTTTANYNLFPPIQSASNTTVLGASPGTTTLPASGGVATTSITLTNPSTTDVTLDDFTVTLPTSPATPSFVPGSGSYNGNPLADPDASGNILAFVQQFVIPAGSSSTVQFALSYPATTGTYAAGVVAHIGSTQIDTTADTTDNAPVTDTVTVGLAPTNTPSSTPSPSVTPTATAPATASVTPTDTAVSTDTPTATPTETASPTSTVAASATNAPAATSTSTAFATGTSTASPLPTDTSTGTPSATTTPTATSTASPTDTSTTAPTATSMAVSADLSVNAKTSQDQAEDGQQITETVTLSNSGPSVAVSPVMTMSVPTATTFASLTAPAGWTCARSAAFDVVTCRGSSMAVGEEMLFTLVSDLPGDGPTGTLTASASASSATADPNLGNNTRRLTVSAVAAADLSVDGSASPNPAVAGSDEVYTASVTNAGPSDARGSVFTAAIPSGSTYVSSSASGPWSCANPGTGSTFTCTAASVPAGASARIILIVHTAPDLAAGATLHGASTVTSLAHDPNHANNTAATDVAVSTSADLAAAVHAAPAGPRPGQPFASTILVSNAGPSDASALTVSLPVPAHTTALSAVGPTGAQCAMPLQGEAGAVLCTLPRLAASNAASFTLTFQVDSAATAGTAITMTASVGSQTSDPTTGNNASSAIAATAAATATAMPSTATSTAVPATEMPALPALPALPTAPPPTTPPAAPDFFPVNGAYASSPLPAPLFVSHQRGTLRLLDATGFTANAPVRVSLLAAGSRKALISFTARASAAGVVNGQTSFTPRTAGVYLVTAVDVATGRRVQKPVVALLPMAQEPATQYFAEGFTGAASDERHGYNADIAGTDKVAVYATQFALINRSRVPTLARVTYVVETSGNGVRVAPARPDVVRVVHVVVPYGTLMIDTASDIASARVSSGPDAGRYIAGGDRRIAMSVTSPVQGDGARVVAERIIERRAPITGAWLSGPVNLATSAHTSGVFPVDPDKRTNQAYLMVVNPFASRRVTLTLSARGAIVGHYSIDPLQRITVNLTDLRRIQAGKRATTVSLTSYNAAVVAEESVYTGAGYGSLRPAERIVR